MINGLMPKSITKKETRGRPKLNSETPLTRKQELFVKELVSKDGQITMREAAINAGLPLDQLILAHTK